MTNFTGELEEIFKTTKLHIAVSKGDAEGLRRLLESGADVNTRDHLDMTPLMFASFSAEYRDMNGLTSRLLSRGTNSGETPDEQKNETSNATQSTLEGLAQRLARDFDPRQMLALLDSKREYDDTPVDDDPGIVAILLEFGADVHATQSDGNTALMLAVQAGNVNIARLLIEHGADIRATDNNGLTPLMLAARERKLEVVQMLLAQGADVDYRTPQGGTPLMAAAMGGRVEIAELFLSLGQHVDAVSVNGITALQLAAAKRHAEMIALLRDRGAPIGFLEAVLLGDSDLATMLPVPDVAERTSNWGQTALSTVTRQGRPDLMRRLLAQGVDPNIEYKHGQTLLTQAVMRGNADCVRLLLEAGAVVDTPGQFRSPLQWAGSRGDKEMVDLLVAHGANARSTTTDGDSPLSAAVMSGNLETARRLLESGADPSIKYHGMPLLNFAIVRQNQDMVRLLLDFGANPKEGHTMLIARQNQSPTITGMLHKAAGTDLHQLAKEGKTEDLLARLNEGADIDTRDECGRTLLMQALRSKHIATARELMARGADVNASNDFQQSVLYHAIFAEGAEIVAILLDRGAEVASVDVRGETPLTRAALNDHKEIVAQLIEAGAPVGIVEAALLDDLQMVRNLLDAGTDVNTPNAGGITPLMAAAARGNDDMVSVLLIRYAEIDATDSEGRTPLAWAVAHRHLSTARLLLDQGADVNRAGVNRRMVESMQRRFIETGTEIPEAFEGWQQAAGTAPLGYAAMLGDIKSVRLLLAHGADVNAGSGPGFRTALLSAVFGNHTEVVRLLLEQGADPRPKHKLSLNILDATQRQGTHEEIIILLQNALE